MSHVSYINIANCYPDILNYIHVDFRHSLNSLSVKNVWHNLQATGIVRQRNAYCQFRGVSFRDLELQDASVVHGTSPPSIYSCTDFISLFLCHPGPELT